jgi:SAM-dependent methyltransferase
VQTFRRLVKGALLALNIDLYLRTPDRAVLERQLLPWLAALPNKSDILFVGCDWYTRGYRKYFAHRNYVTMDYDVDKAKYGARRHITDSMTNLREHFQPASLDLIVCNGVFGWGLNTRPDVEKAFSGSAEALRPGGLLLIGWNDIPERRPFDLQSIEALASLRRHTMDPLGTDEYLTPSVNRHVYTLFQRP